MVGSTYINRAHCTPPAMAVTRRLCIAAEACDGAGRFQFADTLRSELPAEHTLRGGSPHSTFYAGIALCVVDLIANSAATLRTIKCRLFTRFSIICITNARNVNWRDSLAEGTLYCLHSLSFFARIIMAAALSVHAAAAAQNNRLLYVDHVYKK